MPDTFDEGRRVFLGEARELIDELESALLLLEERPDDSEAVARVFRAMHTLKGSGSMFSFDDISEFTHEIETFYDLVRSGRLPVTNELIDLSFRSLDQIGRMLDAYTGGSGADPSVTREIIGGFAELARISGCAVDSDGETKVESAQGARPVPPVESGEAAYEILFRPSADIMLNGTKPLSLIGELHGMGECIVKADTGEVPCLEDIDPERCYTTWDILLKTRQCTDEVRDVFIFVEDDGGVSVKRVQGLCIPEGNAGHRLIGDLLVEKGAARPEAVRAALGEKKLIGEMLLEMGEITEEGLKSALDDQKALDREWREKSASSIRVASEKLDVLADLVGEMVTTQARLRRLASDLADPELRSVTEEMDKLTEMLRDNTLSIRMVRIGTTFTRFKRLVRDLSRALGREVEFTTGGGETELDKTVIERLNDPIMHLLRNSIDHGIEPPDERESKGKPRRGKVSLDAAHAGGEVVIRVSDDGRGLDPERLRLTAIERGLLNPDDTPSDQELYALTMSAGFSTAASVSSVSGRGVGMDVVKKTMESVRGSVDISSSRGVGTDITLVLPLTLAIIEGLLVRIGEMSCIVPLSVKSECMERVNSEAVLAGAGDFMDVRGELVPCVRLRDFFGIEGEPPDMEHVVVMEDDDVKAGITVDEVAGEHQAVIKPLSSMFSEAEGVSGATILGDGTVALILDAPEIIRLARKDYGRATRAA